MLCIRSHCSVVHLQFIFRYYYSSKSSAEHGTLYQLRNAISRTNVVKALLDNFNACDDFFVLVIKCHIHSAVKMMKMNSLDDVPSEMSVANPENVLMLFSMEEWKSGKNCCTPLQQIAQP